MPDDKEVKELEKAIAQLTGNPKARVIAITSMDDLLLDPAHRGKDLMKVRAGEMFGVAYDAVTDDMVSAAQFLTMVEKSALMELAKEEGIDELSH